MAKSHFANEKTPAPDGPGGVKTRGIIPSKVVVTSHWVEKMKLGRAKLTENSVFPSRDLILP